MTAADFISTSLRLIGVLAPGESASGSALSDALESLNDLAESLSVDGIQFQTFATTSDNFVQSGEYRRAMKYALAIELAPEYSRPVPPGVAASHQEAMGILTKKQTKPAILKVDEAMVSSSHLNFNTRA